MLLPVWLDTCYNIMLLLKGVHETKHDSHKSHINNKLMKLYMDTE